MTDSSSPIIGITTSLEDGKQGLDLRYVQAVEAAGGVPVILPVTASREVAHRLMGMTAGLVIPGGPAIKEGLIGTLPDDIEQTDERRSTSDRLYLEVRHVLERPVLGICYGMQLINAMAGGSIHADVQAAVDGTEVHSSVRGGTVHGLVPEQDSWLSRLLGSRPRQVNTRHIQAVASVGRGLRVAARAPDGVIEAVESPDGTVLGVQWHPERQIEDMLPLFQHLVERARR